MGYTGRHRKNSNATIAKRAIALATTFAGIAAGAGTAAAQSPLAGIGSLADDVIGNVAEGAPSIAKSAPSVNSLQQSQNRVVRPAAGEFTSGYGPRWGTFHYGVDIANGMNTPIYAVMAGTVIDSGPASGYGQWIRIRHNDGSVSVYGHMETLGVSVGETVSAGQYIAGMGSRGHSTGPHLHFEIHPDGTNAVDPEPWFQKHGIYLR